MKIQIENYYGNDVLTLVYNELDVNISDKRIVEVDNVVCNFGYNIADIDTDDNGINYIRVQECDVDNSDKIAMVNKLNQKFL